MKKLNNLIDNAREKLKMFRLMILVLLINSFVLAQEKDWTLQLIQSNCPDIGTDEICNDTPFSEFTIRGTEGDEEDDERWWWANANTLGLSNYDKGSIFRSRQYTRRFYANEEGGGKSRCRCHA